MSSSDSDDHFNFFGVGKIEDRIKSHKQEEVASKPRVVLKLVDIAAKVTAQHYPCEALETHVPPLDESMLKKVTTAYKIRRNHSKVVDILLFQLLFFYKDI